MESSYGFNQRNLNNAPLSSVANPAETLFFADSGRAGEVHPYATRVAAAYHINRITVQSAPIGIRHDYKPNLLWVDGHVSTLQDVVSIHLSDEFGIENKNKWCLLILISGLFERNFFSKRYKIFKSSCKYT